MSTHSTKQATPETKDSGSFAVLPASFPVSVIMQSRPAISKWVDEVWDAIGLVVISPENEAGSDRNSEVRRIEQGKNTQLIYSGLSLQLHLDECESYYHNLMSPEPTKRV